MPLLYHYIPPETKLYGKADVTQVAPKQLRTMTLGACDPSSFNDPFEVRPCFDQERHDYYSKSHESFSEQLLGIKHSLIAGRSMVDFPTENAVGFAENLNKRFRDELAKKWFPKRIRG